MGLFSWTTADTNESIMNKWSPRHQVVYLLTPKKNIKCVSYGGYGDFITSTGDSINLTEHEWIVDAKGREQMSFNGLPLRFSFNKDAIYEACLNSDNCPLQGHDWSDSDATTYDDYDFSKGIAGKDTGEQVRNLITELIYSGTTLKEIATICERSVSTMRQIKSGSIKNPPQNLLNRLIGAL